MANDEDSIEDKTDGDATDPAPDGADGVSDRARDIAGSADKTRELAERVRRKIRSVSSKNKRYVN